MDRGPRTSWALLGTVINALALQDALERVGLRDAGVVGIHMAEVCEPTFRVAPSGTSRRVASSSRAGWETPISRQTPPPRCGRRDRKANAIVEGTHSGVDGVYSADPLRDANATRYEEIGFLEVVSRTCGSWTTPQSRSARQRDPILVFESCGRQHFEQPLVGER